MKDYQRQKNNKYILPAPVWHQTLWQIRDYYRLKEKADELIMQSHDEHEPVSNSAISDPTYQTAVKRERYVHITDIIDAEKRKIPQEYQAGVWNNVMYRERYPDDAHRNTYSMWKSRFVYGVAERLGLY